MGKWRTRGERLRPSGFGGNRMRSRGRGGTGRRAGFRFPCLQRRAGSIPVARIGRIEEDELMAGHPRGAGQAGILLRVGDSASNWGSFPAAN